MSDTRTTTQPPARQDMVDARGIVILPTDSVTIISWGSGARAADCGTVSPVVGFGRTRIIVIDSDRQHRSVNPNQVMVRRRDGQPGHEANNPTLCSYTPEVWGTADNDTIEGPVLFCRTHEGFLAAGEAYTNINTHAPCEWWGSTYHGQPTGVLRWKCTRT